MEKSKINLPNGTKVKIIGNSSVHNLPIGKKIEIENWNGSMYEISGLSKFISPNNFELLYQTIDFRKKVIEIDDEIESLENQKDDIENIISFMENNSQVYFDEDEYKAYQILNTLDDSGLPNYEKAKEISRIMNQ